MQRAHRHLVTEEEFLSLPESMTRTELLDGEVIASPSPTVWHQEVLRRILAAFDRWSRAQPGPLFIGQSPLDVRFAKGRILQPDAFVLFERVPASHRGPITRVPELCIEVVSENRLHDRVTKRLVYAAAGVKEYWVIEPAGLVERWTGPELSTSEELRERLTSPLLPGFELDLDELFAIDARP